MNVNDMKKTPNILRLLFALIFILGAVANVVMLIASPELYSEFASASFLTIYKQLWFSIVYPNLGLLLGVVILLEGMIAIFLLSKGKYVKIGLLLATMFMLVLVPFWWYGGSLMNLIFALIFIWLYRFSYPTTMWESIREILGKK
jgi:hypothetical protein